MNNSLFLVDTNILVYSDNKDSEFYQSAKKFLEENLAEQKLVISLQNITEYYSLVTNKKRVPKAVTSKEAESRIKKWLESGLYKIIIPNVTTPITLLRLLESLSLTGSDIFDVSLAATMIDNGIDTIYTADTKIFKKLGLKAINPLT